MAKKAVKKAAKKTAKKKTAAKQTRKQAEKVLRSGSIRKRQIDKDQALPGMEDIKDKIAMKFAAQYADAMFESEEAQRDAEGFKQSVRSRMAKIGATHLTAHGYEFSVIHGEDAFKVRKLKRGTKPDTSEAPETGGEAGGGADGGDLTAMDADPAGGGDVDDVDQE